jgi:hypothetical protein
MTIAEYAVDDVEEEALEFRLIFSQAGAELIEALRIRVWGSLPGVTMSSPSRGRVDLRWLMPLLKLPPVLAEPGEFLRHVLAAPVPLDLALLGAETENSVRSWTERHGLMLGTVGEFLTHPRPLVDLLKLLKDFAKDNRIDPESPWPREVSTVLYYASIAAGLARCGHRISSQDDETLRQGFQWGIDQPWVDESLRELFRGGLESLGS